jgi:hypothetical protein
MFACIVDICASISMLIGAFAGAVSSAKASGTADALQAASATIRKEVLMLWIP